MFVCDEVRFGCIKGGTIFLLPTSRCAMMDRACTTLLIKILDWCRVFTPVPIAPLSFFLSGTLKLSLSVLRLSPANEQWWQFIHTVWTPHVWGVVSFIIWTTTVTELRSRSVANIIRFLMLGHDADAKIPFVGILPQASLIKSYEYYNHLLWLVSLLLWNKHVYSTT